MKNILFCLLLVPAYIFLTGCADEALAPLDEKPIVKADKNFLGIWKEASKPGQKDYLLVQEWNDSQREFDSLLKKDSLNNDVIGMQEIRKIVANEKKKVGQVADNYFVMTNMENGNDENSKQFMVYPSMIGQSMFLNVIDGNPAADPAIPSKDTIKYLLVKILRASSKHDTLVTAFFNSDSLKTIMGSSYVRAFVTRNLNNRKCYMDTMTLYKASSYHEDL